MTDDLDQAMQDVLLAMTMLSYGSTSAWDSNGGSQGKPGSRILVLVDRPIADVYRERWENAHGPTSRRGVLEDARRELDQWRGHGIKRPEGETQEEVNARMLYETRGVDLHTAALAFRTTPTRLGKLRKAAGLTIERGYLITGMAPADAAARLKQAGMTQQQIAPMLGVSQPTVSRLLGQRRNNPKAA